MLLREGTHILQRNPDEDKPFVLDYACASSPEPSWLSVYVNGTMIEHCYIGPYSPHTWWGNNPLLTERQIPAPGERVAIRVGPNAILRLESNLIPDG